MSHGPPDRVTLHIDADGNITNPRLDAGATPHDYVIAHDAPKPGPPDRVTLYRHAVSGILYTDRYDSMYASEYMPVDYVLAHAAEAGLRVAQACIDWAADTGECHLCGYDGPAGKPHDDACPLAALPTEVEK